MLSRKEIADHLYSAIIINDVNGVNDLLSQGADPNHIEDNACITPLHHAAQNGSLEVIPLLVEAGADIYAQTEPEGHTPLDVALAHGHERVVKILMAYQAGNDEIEQ